MDDTTQPIGPPPGSFPPSAQLLVSQASLAARAGGHQDHDPAAVHSDAPAAPAHAHGGAPPAEAAGFRFRDEAGRGGASGSCTCPTRPGAPTGGSSTRHVRRRSSTGPGPATA